MLQYKALYRIKLLPVNLRFPLKARLHILGLSRDIHFPCANLKDS